MFNNNPKLKFRLKRFVEIATNYRFRYHIPHWDERIILFTFDDGPLPTTPRVLDILDEFHIKATFFLVAENIKKYPTIARQIVERGHVVGLHGLVHMNMKRLSLREFSRQVIEGFGIIEKECGVNTKLFRPPFGQISLIQAFWLLAQGIILFFWSCGVSESGDFDFVNPDIRSADKPNLVGARAIVLLHDYIPEDIIRSSLERLN